MNVCDLTFPSPAENLAADEVLLDLCEADRTGEVLRFWEPAEYFVVLGYANRVTSEVHLEFCRQQGIPIYRRCTGGGTIVQGPGVLNYSLILPISEKTAGIMATNEFVLRHHQEALERLLGKPVLREGQTDLALGDLKFSGNAQRRRQRALLFHGSFLVALDVSLVEKTLQMPSRQPPYRANRNHLRFLMNLGGCMTDLKNELARTWGAREPLKEVPYAQVDALAREKYSTDAWNLKF